MVLAGGLNLMGSYYVDMAFYNSKNKIRYSSWHPSNGILKIKQEIPKFVKSCAGIKEELKPLPKSRLPDITDFEIH